MLEYFSELDYQKSPQKIQILAVEGATLIESQSYKFFDEVWVLTVDRPTAISRIQKRDPHLSLDEITARLDRQLTNEERVRMATWWYDTSDDHPFDENMVKVKERLRRIIA